MNISIRGIVDLLLAKNNFKPGAAITISDFLNCLSIKGASLKNVEEVKDLSGVLVVNALTNDKIMAINPNIKREEVKYVAAYLIGAYILSYKGTGNFAVQLIEGKEDKSFHRFALELLLPECTFKHSVEIIRNKLDTLEDNIDEESYEDEELSLDDEILNQMSNEEIDEILKDDMVSILSHLYKIKEEYVRERLNILNVEETEN